MFRFAAPLTVRLSRHEVLGFEPDNAVRLKVSCGTVWVTQAGDAADHFLHEGDTLELRRGSRATISGEVQASLRLEDVQE